jgi:hypothetical protein
MVKQYLVHTFTLECAARGILVSVAIDKFNDKGTQILIF